MRRAATALRRSSARLRSVSTVLKKFSKAYTLVNQHKSQHSPYVVGQKYRLKLTAISAYAPRLAQGFFSPQLVQQRATSVRGRHLTYARMRRVVSVLTFRMTLMLQSFRGRRRLRQRLPRRRFRKLAKKKALSRFLRKHKVRIKKFRLKYDFGTLPGDNTVRKHASRLQSVRFRRGRNSGRGVAIRTIRRRW